MQRTYLPRHFEETRVEVLHDLVRANPLGALVVLGREGLIANHVPFELIAEPAPFGTLRCHVSRANTVWREFSPDVEALAIFQASQAYVTPSWYASKREDGKVVPTWNYAVVHAHGTLQAIEDAEWLRGLVSRLTDRFEAPRDLPWKVTDAPPDFVDKQLRGIVGLEMPITKLIGKWKMSQNRSAEDRAGVVEGLRESDDHDTRQVADDVEERGKGDRA
jgi:transcriptional regulator